jgi:hypothetical protein
VGAVVDQHAAAGDRRVGVPAPRHVDPGGEGVLHQHHVAEGARLEQALGADHVLHVAELRRHREERAAALGGRHHRAGAGDVERERLLAQDRDAALEQVRADRRVGDRRRRHQHGLAAPAHREQLRVRERLAAEVLGHRVGRVGAHVHDGGHLRHGRLAQRLGVGLGDRARAHQADPHPPAHRPPSSTAARSACASASTWCSR